MRSLVLALGVALGLFAFTHTADARPRRAKKTVATKSHKASPHKRDKPSQRNAKRHGRIAVTAHTHRHIEIRGPIAGQSIGAPWQGRLREPVRLAENDAWVIRRPWRSFGTHTTVEYVEHVLADIAYRFPGIHPIAIGDISAEHGGKITQHSSHQSGRDIDIGLIFTHAPAGYPASFVRGTAENLDLEATFVLVEEFAKTTEQSGGAQMIFLDFDVQGLLYQWALENGETEESLAHLFQFPHGRGSSAGIVRHEPYHTDHIHVRFRCQRGDTSCR